MRDQEYPSLDALLSAVRGCRACEKQLPLGPRPVLRARETARILIVGQAPGARVHASGIPWDDPSGDRLRAWMGLDADRFHDDSRVAIIPMGYCYPGRGNGGDLPPRRECAGLWLDHLLARLPHIELTLLIGLHAQAHFLGRRRRASLTETVRAWRDYAPEYLPLPHPSARNTPWFRRNPWFEGELLPGLRDRVARSWPSRAARSTPLHRALGGIGHGVEALPRDEATPIQAEAWGRVENEQDPIERPPPGEGS